MTQGNLKQREADLIKRGQLGSNIVYQHNNLITACYDLTVIEKKLLLGCISKINSFDNISSETAFSFDMQEAQEALGFNISNTGLVAKYREAAKGLMTKIVSHDSEDGWEDTTFAQTSKYDSVNKVMTIYFSKGIIPYLSNLHEKFTKYRLMHVGNLNSKYAIRLYEFIVMWIGESYGKAQSKKFTLEEFDKMLNTRGTSYLESSVSMFKRRVVELSCKQINEHTDIEVSAKYHKAGRKITHVELCFKLKDDWIEAETKFKKILSEEQVRAIANNPDFFNKYYQRTAENDVSSFLKEAIKKLRENPKKYFPDYKNYFKGEVVNVD